MYVLVLWKQPSFKQTSETTAFLSYITHCVHNSWPKEQWNIV